MSGHPRLSDGTHIHTSVLVQVIVDTEGHCLLLVTHSGNHYCLAGGDIRTEKWERTDKNLNLFGVSSFGKCAVADAVRKKEKMGKELEKRLSENELFLMMLGERCTEAFFKDSGDIIHELDVKVHIGMFQDSILCARTDVADLRYFPKGLGTPEIEPYHVSSNIERIHLYNMGTSDILLIKKFCAGYRKSR